jgi:hypothetical protein
MPLLCFFKSSLISPATTYLCVSSFAENGEETSLRCFRNSSKGIRPPKPLTSNSSLQSRGSMEFTSTTMNSMRCGNVPRIALAKWKRYNSQYLSSSIRSWIYCWSIISIQRPIMAWKGTSPLKRACKSHSLPTRPHIGRSTNAGRGRRSRNSCEN